MVPIPGTRWARRRVATGSLRGRRLPRLAANQFVRTPDDLELVAAEFARGQAAQSIVYSEVIFTAMIFIRNGMQPHAP